MDFKQDPAFSNKAINQDASGNFGFGMNPDGSARVDVNGAIKQSAVISSMLKADSSGRIVPAIKGTDYTDPVSVVAGVSSVFGRTGAVVAASGDYTTTQVTEGTNLYYTDTRARAAHSITNTGSSGAASYNSITGVFNIPNYTLSGLGGVPTTRTLTINGTALDLSADRSWTVTSMVYPAAGIAVSTGTAWGTSITDNSTNWNTAYGWGNHASAGYLSSSSSLAWSKVTGAPAFITSYTETDTLASVTGRGATTSTQISISQVGLDHIMLNNRFHLIGSSNFHITNNAYYNAGFKYQTAQATGKLAINSDGTLDFSYAAAGTIDAAVTYSSLFSIATNGVIKLPYYTTNGFLKFSGSDGTVSVDTNTYLTSITSANVTTALGYTPLSSYTETDTLASVTSRGSSTTAGITVNGDMNSTGIVYSRANQTTSYTTAALWTQSFGSTLTGIAFHISGVAGRMLYMNTTDANLYWNGTALVYNSGTWAISVTGSAGSVAWTNVSGRPTALSSFTNDLGNYGGWITSSGSISGNAATATTASSLSGLTINNSGAPINPDNVTQNQIGYNSSVSLFGQTDGGLYSSAYSSAWIHQIYGDFRTGQIAIRGKNAGTWQAWRTVIDSGNIGSQSVSYATAAGSASANGGTATALNSSNYISQRGSNGSWNADFTSTPAGTMSYGGDLGANGTNGPGGSWWIQENFRHTNGSNYWGTQVAWGWEDNANRLATRNVTGGSFGGWVYYLNSSNYTSYAPSLTGSGASGTWGISISGNAATATNASSASSAGYAGYLPTAYAGGVQNNPQVYFNNGIGLKVAMTGAWSTWSDTVWVNGYSGGDVPWTVAMHFLRNSEPRMALSAQTQGSTSYGSYYEVFTDYNVGSKRTNALKFWATSHPNDYYIVNNWTGAHWQLTTNHGSPVRVGYADNSGSTDQREYNYLRINSNNHLYLDYNYGQTVVGVYSSYRYQGVFSMGTSWMLPLDGTGPGNLYGLAWSHPNAGGQAGYLSNHGLLVMVNGVTQAAITSSIWCTGDITAYSDRRVKENITNITNPIEKIKAINGVTYTRNDMDNKSKRHAGVIAQEVLEVLPEVVSEDVEGRYSVAYGNLNALLIEAVKEQQKQIEELKSIINGIAK